MWCECMMKGKGEMLCGAHLHEARAFPCPYVDGDCRVIAQAIVEEARRLNPPFKFCQDYIPGSDSGDSKTMTETGAKMKLETMVMVENCMTWACFTALAITFEKWWIIFFAALFHLHIKGGGES